MTCIDVVSKVRIVQPGLTHFITRRAVCRFYLFRPDRETTQAFLYCLGIAANEHGIVLHEACLMSTHYHLVLTDVRGCYPDFLERFNGLLANVMKVLRGWPHEVFNGSGPSVVDLRTTGAIIDKCAYTIANPVACGAVRYAREWPGFITRPSIEGRTYRIERPSRFFDPDGDMLECVSVRFELSEKLIAEHGERGALSLIENAIEAKEAQARAAVINKGHRFLGADRVRNVSPYRRAKAYEVFDALNPTFATKGGGREAYREAAERYLTFQAEYRDAYLRFRAGERDVLFPYGTWVMRVRYGARCAEPPPT